MTEGEWQTSEHPPSLLEALSDRASERKLRLYACACCRLIWHLLIDDRSRSAVEVAERLADDLATDEESLLALPAAAAA